MARREQGDRETGEAFNPAHDPSRSELLLYGLAVLIGVAIMLLVPRLLNNMILVFGVLMLVVWLLPAWLRKRD